MITDTWEHFSHPADMGIRGLGQTRQAALEQAALPLTALTVELDTIEPHTCVAVACEETDPELLLVAWLNAVTGWDLTPDEYLKTGERILSLRKAFNIREGIKPEDHALSERALGKTPLTKGPLRGVTLDMGWLMKEFYDTVGWDLNTGGPTPVKMKELEIEWLCD